MSYRPHPDLREHRLRRDWTQERMAALAGISRQAYSALESGRSVPSVEVALRLARGLGVAVESLFELTDVPPPVTQAERALGGPAPGGRTRTARIAGRTLAFGLEAGGSHALTLADALAGPPSLDGALPLEPLPEPPPPPDLVVAGCDPAFGLVADFLRRERGLEVLWLPAGSRRALEALARGELHVAGIHLRDPRSGRYNAPWVERLVPFPATRIGFALWEQVLIVGPGNPFGIDRPGDLARPGLRFVNREPGSGSRALIELQLREEGIPEEAVAGYRETAAASHSGVAEAVHAGTADAGVAIRAVALARGLTCLPLAREPYDLVVPDHFLELPAVEALLDALRRPALQRQVEALGGYDTAPMGRPG